MLIDFTDDELNDIVDALAEMGEATGQMRFFDISDKIIRALAGRAVYSASSVFILGD